MSEVAPGMTLNNVTLVGTSLCQFLAGRCAYARNTRSRSILPKAS
jgi:hypothetical protein